MTTQTLQLSPSVRLDLSFSAPDRFEGIGGVTVDGVPLRAPDAPPLRPFFKSVRGVVYTHFRCNDTVERPEGGVELHTTAVGHPALEGAYGDEYDVPQLYPQIPDPVVEDDLVWVLEPAELEVEGLLYRGFSYAWRFASATERIFRVTARATWELGGSAEGDTLLSLGQVTPPVYTARRDTHFTSACLKQVKRFGDPLGMSFQLAPRYGVHAPFDFQAGPLGSLLGYWPAPADVRSFVQKNPGEDVVWVLDATHVAAASRVEVAPKRMLFAPAGPDGLPEHAMRNRWKAAHDLCGDLTRSFYGVKRSRPRAESTIGYACRYEGEGRLRVRVGDRWVPSQEWLPAMADTYFDDLAARGIKRVIPEPVCQTDPSERGRICKLDDGIHGDLNVGSVCCVHRYVVADLWGGAAAWQYYYREARKRGLEVGHWVGPHMAYNAPIFQEHPEWRIQGFNTLSFAGGYPNFELASLNLNTGVRQWLLDDLRRWREENGLDYVWFDSIGNLGMLPIDYAANMQPNAEAVARFVAGLQEAGLDTVAVEGMSPFGISSAGVFDPNQGDIRVAQDIVGQNSFDWFVGNEDMLCDQAPRIELHRDRGDEEAQRIFFRLLANRTVPLFGRYSKGFGPRPDWFRSSLDTYEAVEDNLVRRTLLPGRRGVRWSGGRHEVLFAFEEVRWDVGAGAAVERMEAGTPRPVEHDGTVLVPAWNVYRSAGKGA